MLHSFRNFVACALSDSSSHKIILRILLFSLASSLYIVYIIYYIKCAKSFCRGITAKAQYVHIAQLDGASDSDTSARHFDESLQSGLNTGFISRDKKLQTTNDYYLTTMRCSSKSVSDWLTAPMQGLSKSKAIGNKLLQI